MKATQRKYFLYPVAPRCGPAQRNSIRAKRRRGSLVHTPNSQEPEIQEEYFPTERSQVAAVAAVAATYVYFLIFAQFGFLQALTDALGAGHRLLKPMLGLMGLAGIGGSVGMAFLLRQRAARRPMMTGYLVAGAAAGLTWLAKTPAVFLASALLAGAGTGMVTVGLASTLRREVGGERLGRCLGVGTGLAYALCNLPPVFSGSAHLQAVLGVAAACTGLIAVQCFEQRAPRHVARGFDYEPAGLAVWTGTFFGLVTLDSAAFYIIQHNPALKFETWAGGPHLFINSGVHLVAAILTGLALDRRRVLPAILTGTGFLLAACTLLTGATTKGTLEAGLYTAGVSVYSTVLIFYPARAGRPGVAALVYSVAGWLGSALGIGLAEGLGRIPVRLVVAAAGLVAAALALRWLARRRVQ